MILGNIKDLPLYFKAEITQPIIDFVQNRDLTAHQAGKYTLSGGIFAIIIKTNSRDLKGQLFETHRKHLDLHCLISGKEILGFASGFGLQASAPYNADGDYLLYHPPFQYSQIALAEKQFALFYPEDAHCAQGHLEKENAITKVVFKILVTLLKKDTANIQKVDLRQVTNLEEALPILWDHDLKNQVINFPGSKPNKELFDQNMHHSYSENPEGFFLVYGDGKMIGSLLLRIKENSYKQKKYGEIWYIYLEPECRGKGYGKKLLDFADEYFTKKECSYAFAGIAAHNPASNLLFERAGYVKTRFILEKEY